jgi:hypothetical protein
MIAKKEDNKVTTSEAKRRRKTNQNDRYYKVKADFTYLAAYNYKITKEIGRGGYGVVYRVTYRQCRQSALQALVSINTL